MKTHINIKIAKDEYDKDLNIDLNKVSHLLVAGKIGSGKSTLLHRIISTLIEQNPAHGLKMILVDTNKVELSIYNKIPHLLTPMIDEMRKAILALRWTTKEIERRLSVLKESGCKNIDEYSGDETMPRILVVVDDFSVLMQQYPKDIEPVVIKIANMGHIAGVNLILCSSRANKKAFTEAILSYIETRIVLQTSNTQDSKIMIGLIDAHKLRGAGDMIYRQGQKYPIHAEVTNITRDQIKAQLKKLGGDEDITDTINFYSGQELDDNDEMYETVKEDVLKTGKVSTSYIQRKFGLGYSRAAKLIDILEHRGIVGPVNGSEPRKVLIKPEESV